MYIPQGLQQLHEVAQAGEHGVIHLKEQLQAGGPYQAWYPSLRAVRPQLLVTLHADSLDGADGVDKTARDWLIETGRHIARRAAQPDIDLVVTPFRREPRPVWAAGFPTLGTHLRSEFTQGVYAASLRPNWEELRVPEIPPAGLLDLHLHEETQRHLFVTLDTAALAFGETPESHKRTLVFAPRLAQRYVNLYLKAHDVYRVFPRYSVNRGLYYWLRLWSCIPSFPPAWTYAVFGSDAKPELRDFMHALYARVMGMMQVHDRIGWLRYTPADNDTRDEALNQLNYFIVLMTGALDSLAWLAKHRFQINEDRSNITVRATRWTGKANPFFGKLEAASSGFASYLRDPGYQARIALFYEPRDSIQHRLVPTGAHLNTGQYYSDCNVVFLDKATAQAFERVDRHDPAEEPPFRLWGMMRFAESRTSILEPYRFTGAALRFLFTLLEGGLARLELDQWLEQVNPQIKDAADISLAQSKQHNYPRFVTPLPWIPTVPVT